jgi:hypothetical protein
MELMTSKPRAFRDWVSKAQPSGNSTATDDLTYVEVSPEEIAYYVACHCGVGPLEFIAWLAAEVDFLIGIDGRNK